jgi:hypothetical protein
MLKILNIRFYKPSDVHRTMVWFVFIKLTSHLAPCYAWYITYVCVCVCVYVCMYVYRFINVVTSLDSNCHLSLSISYPSSPLSAIASCFLSSSTCLYLSLPFMPSVTKRCSVSLWLSFNRMFYLVFCLINFLWGFFRIMGGQTIAMCADVCPP